jgi:hypothetical protein
VRFPLAGWLPRDSHFVQASLSFWCFDVPACARVFLSEELFSVGYVFRFSVVCGLLQDLILVTLTLPDQKARDFLISIVLKLLFSEHARKVFGEIPVIT